MTLVRTVRFDGDEKEARTHDVVSSYDVHAKRDLLYAFVSRVDALGAARQDHVGRLVEALELALRKWEEGGSACDSGADTAAHPPLIGREMTHNDDAPVLRHDEDLL